MQRTGKFIVLEGNQGLGKTTQVRLLEKYLHSKQIPSQVFYFPNYSSFFGKMATRFLNGDFGPLESISPYFVALIFANDRSLATEGIVRALRDGKLVICDRWITSNMAIQAVKIKPGAERDIFIDWVNQLEYSIFGQPSPDWTIYLRASPEYSLRNLKTKISNSPNKKPNIDIEEASEALILESFLQYEKLAARLPNWITLNMEINTPNGPDLISVQETQQAIINILEQQGALVAPNQS